MKKFFFYLFNNSFFTKCSKPDRRFPRKREENRFTFNSWRISGS
ncbi:MAG: hypothetical protein ABIN61_04915 [candidate division WOR-3 bacterium]